MNIVTEWLNDIKKMPKVEALPKHEPETRDELIQLIKDLYPLAIVHAASYAYDRSLPIGEFHPTHAGFIKRAARAIGEPNPETGPVVPEGQKVGHSETKTPENTQCDDCPGNTGCSLREARKKHETCTLKERCIKEANA